MPEAIERIQTHLVSAPVTGGLADSTRRLDLIGYTIVRVTTTSGVEGIGVTYNEVGGTATKTLIDDSIAPRLIGRDPFETEVIWHDLFQYLRGVGRKGLAFCAVSAVDIALWDLKGKLLGLPLVKLLGGGRTRVPVYASGGWTSYSDRQLVDEMVGMVDQGYSAIKFKVGVDNAGNVSRDVSRVYAVREAVGEDVQILLDANNCWDAATAVQFANRVRDANPVWLEEPVLADDIPGLARYRRGTDVPVATGEHEYTRYGVRDLLLAEAADVVQSDITRVGGFTEMLKIAALTQAWNVKLAPHAMELLHMHLVAAAPNAIFLERLALFEALTARTFANAPQPRNGWLELPDRPGLGLELDLDWITHQESR